MIEFETLGERAKLVASFSDAAVCTRLRAVLADVLRASGVMLGPTRSIATTAATTAATAATTATATAAEAAGDGGQFLLGQFALGGLAGHCRSSGARRCFHGGAAARRLSGRFFGVAANHKTHAKHATEQDRPHFGADLCGNRCAP